MHLENSKFCKIVVVKENAPDASAQAFDFSAEASADVVVLFPSRRRDLDPRHWPITITSRDGRMDARRHCLAIRARLEHLLSGRTARPGRRARPDVHIRNGELPPRVAVPPSRPTRTCACDALSSDSPSTAYAGPALLSGEASSYRADGGKSQPSARRCLPDGAVVGAMQGRTTTVTATSCPFNAPWWPVDHLCSSQHAREPATQRSAQRFRGRTCYHVGDRYSPWRHVEYRSGDQRQRRREPGVTGPTR